MNTTRFDETKVNWGPAAQFLIIVFVKVCRKVFNSPKQKARRNFVVSLKITLQMEIHLIYLRSFQSRKQTIIATELEKNCVWKFRYLKGCSPRETNRKDRPQLINALRWPRVETWFIMELIQLSVIYSEDKTHAVSFTVISMSGFFFKQECLHTQGIVLWCLLSDVKEMLKFFQQLSMAYTHKITKR